ncbi:Solute carrier family 12 member [Trichinella pseudospiralis]
MSCSCVGLIFVLVVDSFSTGLHENNTTVLNCSINWRKKEWNKGWKSFVELELFVASSEQLSATWLRFTSYIYIYTVASDRNLIVLACDPTPVGLVNCHLGY